MIIPDGLAQVPNAGISLEIELFSEHLQWGLQASWLSLPPKKY